MSADTEQPLLLGMSSYTTREGDELFRFILDHLDEEERAWFTEDIAKAVVEAWRAHSFEPLGRVLAGWEETVELKLDPALSHALDEAFDEADAARATRDC